MNKKRSFYNIVVGIGSQVLAIALGIIIPRLFLKNFGSEMNGFLNSVSQIITYFTLFEVGVGAASLQALYGPVGAEDRNAISSIIIATRKYYKKTGFVYLFSVVLLSVVYPFVVTSDIDKWTMVVIILMNGLPGTIGYMVQGRFVILMQAEGKNYISIALTSISSTIISLLKIVLLVLGCNILAIQASYFVINLLKITVLVVYIRKKYVWVDPKATPNFAALNQKNAAFVNQICDFIFRNTDVILLAIICDLKTVSVYSMYAMLYSMVRTVLDYVAQGFSFLMGQAFNKGLAYFTKLYDLYETYRMALIFSLYNIALIFIVPFMKLYTSGIEDVNYLDYNVALLFAIYFLLTGSRACEADVIGYAQHYKLTQGRAITEAVINLSVSIVCAIKFGIYGVLIGTIVALLYRSNDMFLYANHQILQRSAKYTYKRVFTNSVVFVLIMILSARFSWNLESYLSIVLYAIISGIVIVPIYFTVASVTNVESYVMLKRFVMPYLRRNLKNDG